MTSQRVRGATRSARRWSAVPFTTMARRFAAGWGAWEWAAVVTTVVLVGGIVVISIWTMATFPGD